MQEVRAPPCVRAQARGGALAAQGTGPMLIAGQAQPRVAVVAESMPVAKALPVAGAVDERVLVAPEAGRAAAPARAVAVAAAGQGAAVGALDAEAGAGPLRAAGRGGLGPLLVVARRGRGPGVSAAVAGRRAVAAQGRGPRPTTRRTVRAGEVLRKAAGPATVVAGGARVVGLGVGVGVPLLPEAGVGAAAGAAPPLAQAGQLPPLVVAVPLVLRPAAAAAVRPLGVEEQPARPPAVVPGGATVAPAPLDAPTEAGAGVAPVAVAEVAARGRVEPRVVAGEGRVPLKRTAAEEAAPQES